MSNWGRFQEIDIAQWPNVKALQERVRERPKVQEAMKAEGPDQDLTPSTNAISSPRPDRHLERADAFDLAFDFVAGHHRADAGRRAGHDDVAGGKLDHLRQFPDRLRHVPDQLVEVAFLLHLAVDLERDAALARMADLRGRHDRAARRGGVERLADFPWPLTSREAICRSRRVRSMPTA